MSEIRWPIDIRGVELIKRAEGLHDGDLSHIGLQPKMCPAGIWTVGWGRALIGKDGQFLKGPADKSEAYAAYPGLTEAEADEMLAQDLAEFRPRVTSLVYVPIREAAVAALVSLSYNIGVRAFAGSTVRRKLNRKDFLGAADAFRLWNKGGGRVLPGLVKRRLAEKELFLSAWKAGEL